MIPARLQHFLEHLWNDQKWDQMDPRGPYLSPKYFKRYKIDTQTSLNILFSYLRIWNSENIGRSMYHTFWFLGIWKFDYFLFEICKIEVLEFEIRNEWTLNNLEMWKLNVKNGFWNTYLESSFVFGNCQFWKV